MPSTVTVHYPFHPLHNRSLDVIAWPRRVTGAATVQHPDGKPLKIPLWMLQPDVAQFSLSGQAVLSASALLALADMIQVCSKVGSDEPAGAKPCSKSHSISTTAKTPLRGR